MSIHTSLSLGSHPSTDTPTIKSIQHQLEILPIGFTKELAKSKGNINIESIQRIDLQSPAWHERLTDESKFGRHLYKTVLQMLKFFPPVLTDILLLDFSIDDYLHEQIEALALLHTHYGNDKSQPVHKEPNHLTYQYRAEIDAEDEWHENYHYSDSPTTPPASDNSETTVPINTNTIREEIFQRHQLIKKRAYLKAVTAYDEYVLLQHAQKQDAAIRDHQQSTIIVRQTLLDGFQSAINLIASKITNCINKYNKPPHTSVKNKMHDTIIISLTGARISSPFTTNSLPGMLAHLANYNKATLSSFTTDLGELLVPYKSPQLITTKPMNLIRHFEPQLNMFVQMGYSEFLTVDLLFTALALNQIPEGELKRLVVLEMYRRLTKVDANVATNDDTSTIASNQADNQDDHLMHYNHLSKFLEEYQKSLEHGKLPTSPGSPSLPQNDLVDAYSADTTFTKPVSHSDEVYTTHPVHGIKYPYVAQHKLCVLCHGPTATTKHNPKCYSRKCQNCGLFGHPRHACRQK